MIVAERKKIPEILDIVKEHKMCWYWVAEHA
jgi:hypothetical protein